MTMCRSGYASVNDDDGDDDNKATPADLMLSIFSLDEPGPTAATTTTSVADRSNTDVVS